MEKVSHYLRRQKARDIEKGGPSIIAGMRTTREIADAFHWTTETTRRHLRAAEARGEVDCGTDGPLAYWWARDPQLAHGK